MIRLPQGLLPLLLCLALTLLVLVAGLTLNHAMDSLMDRLRQHREITEPFEQELAEHRRAVEEHGRRMGHTNDMRQD
jgi:hypothetical protein